MQLLSGHHILITDGWTDGRTHARTGVTLNAPPPFFECRGHKKRLEYVLPRPAVETETRGPKGHWVAHLRQRSKVTVEPFTEDH